MKKYKFNKYVLKAVDYLYDEYRLRGFGSAILTHDIRYGKYGTIFRTGGDRTMSVAAMMEVILTAMQIYETDTEDSTVWDYLPKHSWEGLGVNDIKAHIWVNHELMAHGTADALRHFNMGENIPFRELAPGSFVNFYRRNGSGHAVVFLSHIDESGEPLEDWNENAVGFRYFSAQGGYEVGTGGLDYRHAIFATDDYEANGYPAMPYRRDIGVIYSTNQKEFNTGILWHPHRWGKHSRIKNLEKKIKT